jgi:ribonuclease HI
MYPICRNLRRNPTNWKNQNTPSLKQATSHITLAGLKLFQSTQPSTHEIKPWEKIPIITDYLEISKKEALSNPMKARFLFYEYKNKLNITSEDYTDGSLNKETKNTTYAAVLPSWNIEEAGTLVEGTSIFTAEAFGILRAMEIAYSHEEYIAEFVIFTNSKSVLKALDGPVKNKHHIIQEIIKTSLNLKSSGTRVRICWVPSHVGILGNERADTLVNLENSLNSRTSLDNALSISEETSIFKLYLKEFKMKELKMSNDKVNIQKRKQPGFLKWHLHKFRTITRILFRLRTGHNRLRAQPARHRPE